MKARYCKTRVIIVYGGTEVDASAPQIIDMRLALKTAFFAGASIGDY